MPHSTAYTMSHCASGVIFTAWLAVGAPTSASANVITDWDEKAIAVVFPTGPIAVSQQVYTAQRMMGMVHVAMFDAVNSIVTLTPGATGRADHVTLTPGATALAVATDTGSIR